MGLHQTLIKPPALRNKYTLASHSIRNDGIECIAKEAVSFKGQVCQMFIGYHPHPRPMQDMDACNKPSQLKRKYTDIPSIQLQNGFNLAVERSDMRDLGHSVTVWCTIYLSKLGFKKGIPTACQ